VSPKISVRDSGDLAIVTVAGRVVIGEASERLHETLRGLIKQGRNNLVVNLEDVPQIDSSGISVLVRNSISLTREGGSLRLVCAAGRVRDALEVTRLVEAIPTFDNEAAALASFA
jgi:anti-anti-sigma factor